MSSERLDHLISGHFDQALDAAERQELDRLLREEPRAALRFASFARLHARLHSRARDQAAVRTPDPDSPVPRPEPAAPLRSPTPIRWRAPLAVAALLLLALGTAWWLGEDPQTQLGHIGTAHGLVTVNGEASADGVIGSGDRVATGPGASVRLELSDGTRLALAAASELVVARQARDWTLLLERGGVDCAVASQPAGMGFVLRTPEARITVLGTRFRVEHGAGRSTVTVSEGRVALAAGAELRHLGPDEQAMVSRGVISEPRAPGVLWQADFERPIDPELWLGGERVASATVPTGNDSDHCMRATVIRQDTGSLLQVTIKDLDSPLFTIVDPGLVLRVRYWANRQTRWMGIWLATEPWQDYRHYHREFTPIADRWVTTTIKLADILNDRSGTPPAVGDRVVHLMIQGEHRHGARLYIDDLSIERE